MNDQYITRGCFHIPNENTEENTPPSQCRCDGRNKLDVYNWLEDIPDEGKTKNIIEVRFKNTRKGYYINYLQIPLAKGDIVAVEASPGHDIGVVSLTGDLVSAQMGRYGTGTELLKKVYRKAKANDIEKWFQSIEKEKDTMRIARQIVADLNLSMKISDVEFQGDKTKATFYYISDERVDFRQLIKEYAEHFRVRIEMKQIGARQEAGKVGGIGTCGRELCCSQWMSSFVSVSTSAARYQEVSLNPQKLAGQCGKLKCCLNYELKCYLDAQSDFPDTSIPLETEQGKAYHNKTDVFRRIIWYSFEKNTENAVLIPLDIDVVKEILELNRQGIKVKELHVNENFQSKKSENNYQNAAGEDSISRFEEKKRKKKKNKDNRNNKGNKNSQPETSEKKPTRADSGEQRVSQNNKNRHKNRNGRHKNDNRDRKKQDHPQQSSEE